MPARHQIDRPEMGLTQADFLRVFAPLVAPNELAVDGASMSAGLAAGGHIHVTLSAAKVRIIGALKLPSLNVHLEFRACTQAAIAEFVGRFDRAFHKGGG